jgi:hypothetical protein
LHIANAISGTSFALTISDIFDFKGTDRAFPAFETKPDIKKAKIRG